MLPFGVGYHSDHRALFIKINLEKILSISVRPINTITARKLTQASPRERKIFLEEADCHFSNQNLYQRLKKLVTIPPSEWDAEHIKEYERCDREMINGMLAAEKKTRRINTTAWSPTFAKAVNTKTFWKITLSQKLTHRKPSNEFKAWANELGFHDFDKIHISEIKQRFRNAQQELKTVEKRADELRNQHRRELLSEAELNSDDANIERRLKILLWAHERKQHYSRLKQILKPRNSGGLSYIIVPENFSIDKYPYAP
jgi:hypothetical protein